MRRAALAIVCLAFAAVSCGGGDDDEGALGSVVTTATPASSTPTVPASGPPASGTGPPISSPLGTVAPADTTVPPPMMTGEEPAVSLTEIGSFDAPVDVAWRAGDEALYVVEQGGTIERVTMDGTSTVLDITDLTDADGERGLLGLTFAPAGDRAYVNHTDLDGNTHIAEHPVDAAGTFGDARRLLFVEQPYANHNGGGLAFGPDGLLYIGLGDGGSGGDPQRRATNPAELLGKLLRIDPTPSGDQPYTIPADNPFVDQEGTAPEIWSSGLRNPWRFSFDARTGDLWIADVGQNEIEEIDVAAATDGRDAGKGESFGWSALEGDVPFNEDVAIADPVPPFFTYTHDEGCSVSGGVRPRGGPVADLVGWYVYGDFCAGRIWALEVVGDGSSMAPGRRVELGELPAVTAVVGGPAGEVYALSGQGPVVRLDPA